MSRVLRCCVVVTAVTFSCAANLPVQAAEKAPQEVFDLIDSELLVFKTDPLIVAAVRQANAAGRSLEQVKELDRQWQDTPGIDDFMRSLLDSECGRYLTKIRETRSYLSEIFVMDRLGAIVAMSDKTTDFWQGDEAKFSESYRSGRGGVHVGNVEFDESAQAYLVQVSLPVEDDSGVIGAITIGIDIDQLDQ